MPIRLYPFYLITLGAVNLLFLNRMPQMVILGGVFLAWGLISLVFQLMGGSRGRVGAGPNRVAALSDELAKLNELKNKGVLSEQEFEAQKRKLLR